MAFGIIVYEYFGNYCVLRVYDDKDYDKQKASLKVLQMHFVDGRKGIPEAEIVDLYRRTFEAVSRRNEDRAISLEAELKKIFDESQPSN